MGQPRSTNDLQGPGGDAAFGKGTGDYMPTRVPARPPSNDWDTTGQGEALDNQGGADEDNENE